MPFLPPFTIAHALNGIQRREFVLPGIQREFVWGPDQICRLFDSLMREYPIGSLLLWKVEPESIPDFSFYEFMRKYHQRDNPFCTKLDDLPAHQALTAVLDGQQRLSALNIGLRGSDARKLPYYRWDSDWAFPQTRLHVNLVGPPPADKRDDEGMLFDFRMLAEDKVPEPSAEEYWFLVPDIMSEAFDGPVKLNKFLVQHGLSDSERPFETLFKLRSVVHEVPLLQAYEEHDQSVDRVLDIFIRTNSAGEPLTRSDLVLSMASSQWTTLDAREEIRELLQHLNTSCGAEFKFDKDLILKAGLALSGATQVSIAARNFTQPNMLAMEKEWDAIKTALRLTVKLLAGFGLSASTLRATAVVIPVAVHLARINADDGYLSSPSMKEDRATIRSWVLRSLLKRGAWSFSGTDTLLTALRGVIRDAPGTAFPAEAVEEEMRLRQRSLTFSEEEIEALLDAKYGAGQTFALLALLYPFVKTTDHHHVDHIHPYASFHRTKLKNVGLDDETIQRWQDLRNRLPNLQLLEGPENIAKQDKPPLSWAREAYPQNGGVEQYLVIHDLAGLDDDVQSFEDFYATRRDRLRTKLVELVGSSGPAAGMED